MASLIEEHIAYYYCFYRVIASGFDTDMSSVHQVKAKVNVRFRMHRIWKMIFSDFKGNLSLGPQNVCAQVHKHEYGRIEFNYTPQQIQKTGMEIKDVIPCFNKCGSI